MLARIFLSFSLFVASLAVSANDDSTSTWTSGELVTAAQAESLCRDVAFRPTIITASVKARMAGKSMPQGARVRYADLRYIPLLHYTLGGEIRKGEMVVSARIADEVADIFRKLYAAHYPIERIALIDDYGADDERSMRANNSSAFCYRTVAGSTRLSKHARGLAIDINPLYNPCFKIKRNAAGDSTGYTHLQPSTATPYVRRGSTFDYKLTPTDLAVRLFKQKGYTWGGDWRTTKDYQHFEKAIKE